MNWVESEPWGPESPVEMYNDNEPSSPLRRCIHGLQIKVCRDSEMQILQVGDLRQFEPYLFDAQTKGFRRPATIQTRSSAPGETAHGRSFCGRAWRACQHFSRAILIGLFGRKTDSEQAMDGMNVSKRQPSETRERGTVCRLLVA